MNETTIKRLLLAKVFSLRRNQFTYNSLDQPQSVKDDVISVAGQSVRRRRVVLTAHGCSVATCTMCPLPDEAVNAGIPVSLDHWMNQLRAALWMTDIAENLHTLTLFHNGNWFCDREVPKEWRTAIYHYLRATEIKELVVESLPQYLTEERLAHAREALGPAIKLTVAIGLQSSSELVRELCIASTCLEGTFKRAVELLHAQGDAAQVFLMFKPPFLTVEESMWDLRESIRYVHACGAMPTVCPMRIAPHTVVADLAEKGLYQPVNLWDLYDALEGLDNVRVAASLLPEWGDLTQAFDVLNHTGSLPKIKGYRPFALKPIEPSRSAILERIQHYLTLCA